MHPVALALSCLLACCCQLHLAPRTAAFGAVVHCSPWSKVPQSHRRGGQHDCQGHCTKPLLDKYRNKGTFWLNNHLLLPEPAAAACMHPTAWYQPQHHTCCCCRRRRSPAAACRSSLRRPAISCSSFCACFRSAAVLSTAVRLARAPRSSVLAPSASDLAACTLALRPFSSPCLRRHGSQLS